MAIRLWSRVSSQEASPSCAVQKLGRSRGAAGASAVAATVSLFVGGDSHLCAAEPTVAPAAAAAATTLLPAGGLSLASDLT